jgi:hypothetical protein
VIGECIDGSVLLVHSSPAGVQINGTTKPASDSGDSEAITLATEYMHKYYPKWDDKFGSKPYMRAYNTYINSNAKEMK